MQLVERERETYREMWAVDAYARNSPGELYLPVFLDMAKPAANARILDAGCGSGKGMTALHAAEFRVTGIDLTRDGLVTNDFDVIEACLWSDLDGVVASADYTYCCDVLEHIPTAFTMLVVAQLLRVTKQSAFFSICFNPDVMGALAGKVLHQTVQPFMWWRDNLSAVGRLIESRDLLNNGVFLLEGRC